MNIPTFSVDEAFDTDGVPTALLVISSDAWSINVWIHHDEIDQIPLVREADWDERKSLRIGRSAGLPAFWSADANCLSLLIGEDDESWDIGITLPLSFIEQIHDALVPLKNWLASTPPVSRVKPRNAP